MEKLKSPSQLLRSESGSLIIIALVGLVILSASFYTGISRLMQTQKHVRGIVIKQQMIAAEGRLHNLLLQPTSYVIPEGQKVAVLNEELLKEYKFRVAGARCPEDTAFCGILIAQKLDDAGKPIAYWDPANTRFTGVITYTGNEVVVKNIEMDVRVPRETVQDSKYMCPTIAPFMAGFKANGELICKTFPPPKECPPVGGYIKGANPNLTVTCGNFGQVISCGSDSYITPPGPQWTGETWTESGCTPRLNPYINPGLVPQ